MSAARTGPQSGEAPDHTSPDEDPGKPPTGMLDELRRAQFSRLDAGGHVYLDYTGGGLYAESQLREHFELLRGGVFANPHSPDLADRVADRVADPPVSRARSMLTCEP